MIVTDQPAPEPPAGDWPVIQTNWTESRDDMVRRLRELNLPAPVSCFGFGELSAVTAAAVNQELGWPGTPPATQLAFKDKAALRSLVGDRAGAPVAYTVCRSPADLPAAAARIGYPVVAKPVDGSGSAGVRLLTNPAEAELAARELTAGTPYLVEEYLTGTEYSVEATSSAGRHRVLAITEKLTTGAPSFVETGHTLPVHLPEQHAAAITALVAATLDAAGYRNGPSHTEVMLTATGPRLIESHGRPGGDRISDMLALALGEDVFGHAMAAVFELPPPAAARPRVAGIRYVTFDHTTPMPEISTALVVSLPGVAEVHISVPAGQVPAPVAKSADRHAFVLAVGDTRDELEARLDTAIRTMTARA
ncbi:ATP-grasp domain-containing protein [Actinoplanes sp. NPDC051851]|uniref:ATP-grasp domain-containing protein n=1 Tax=Actinoplanes sp. NPDC051851 TaxID=3154753 RepID=UPI00342CF8C9